MTDYEREAERFEAIFRGVDPQWDRELLFRYLEGSAPIDDETMRALARLAMISLEAATEQDDRPLFRKRPKQ